MAPIRRPAAGAGSRALALASALLRFALLAVPLLVLRAALSPRPRRLSALSDRELADIGLTREDVGGRDPGGTSAELELWRTLDARGRQ